MKRYGNLFTQFSSFENLLSAYQLSRKGSRRNEENTTFFFHLEQELLLLQTELRGGTWQPQPYRYFEIQDPKQRTISVAAFRDRVVHHALVNVLEPIYERCFIFDSYATRKNKGVHAAVARAQEFIRHNHWFFKTDVEKFFDSIDHEVLIHLLEKKIKDKHLLEVCRKIICNASPNGKGLPIGNLTSQFFANVYLNPLDEFIKYELKVQHYLRYMDDFVLFSSDKTLLKVWRKEVESFLAQKLHLKLKPNATFINSRTNGLRFLGKRIFPGVIRLHVQHLRRITRRIQLRQREYLEGYIDEEKFLQSMGSYWGMLTVYPLVGLRKALFSKQ